MSNEKILPGIDIELFLAKMGTLWFCTICKEPYAKEDMAREHMKSHEVDEVDA